MVECLAHHARVNNMHTITADVTAAVKELLPAWKKARTRAFTLKRVRELYKRRSDTKDDSPIEPAKPVADETPISETAVTPDKVAAIKEVAELEHKEPTDTTAAPLTARPQPPELRWLPGVRPNPSMA